MAFKRERLGPRLVRAARTGDRFRDAHAFIGGTGAVGGTALLQMLSMYEEMFSISPPPPDAVPVLVATGTNSDEIGAFTRRLFRFVESRGSPAPERIRSGYLTASGVFVALERFTVASLPGLDAIVAAPPERRASAAGALLRAVGSDPAAPAADVFDALAAAIAATRPFSGFLGAYAAEHLDGRSFRSVVVGIPVPSLAAYQEGGLALAVEGVAGFSASMVEELKGRFVVAIRDDLARVRTAGLAGEVLIAHTTGVGGMEDEVPGDPSPHIRLAFAHAARDSFLADKARFADELTSLYAEAGLKVLVTAAAIGIDEVRVWDRVPLHRAIRRMLFEADREVFPGAKEAQPPESRESRRAGRPVPARQVLRVFPPLAVPFDDPPGGLVTFERGDDLVVPYAIRSGENGFFSVADADTLYRVMRVASASELGLMLATVALLGEDRNRPWFPGGVCRYEETDGSRHVFDFLRQPALRDMQLSGVEPMSLQDLGGAKHQGELHTLGLLILLHRLRTLDVDAIDPYVDVEHFDARAFLVHRSRSLTFEDVEGWQVDDLARDLRTLVSAERPEDLLELTPSRHQELFPRRLAALRMVLDRALRAVWQVPALGSPILYELDGRTVMRVGYFAAPLGLLVTGAGAVREWLMKAHAESGNPCSFEDYRDFHVCANGFVDLRPHAILAAAADDGEDLTARVVRVATAGELRDHLGSVEPYSVFSTCGLVAVVFRLRALHRLLREAMIELGSLHEFRWQMPRDEAGHVLVVPGVVEALRLVSEGLEKTTGSERMDGIWGYERRPVPDRRGRIV